MWLLLLCLKLLFKGLCCFFMWCVICYVCVIILFIWFIVCELELIILNIFIFCRIFFVVIVFLWICEFVNVIFLGIVVFKWWVIIIIFKCLFIVLCV